jgi:hypothetical protein
MIGTHQPTTDIGAHPAQSDNADLHENPLPCVILLGSGAQLAHLRGKP